MIYRITKYDPTLRDRINRFRIMRQAEKCRWICVRELAARKRGIPGESTVGQLETVVLPDLNQLLGQLRLGEAPMIKQPWLLSYSLAFKDWGWSIKQPTPLFSALCKLNHLCTKLYRGQ